MLQLFEDKESLAETEQTKTVKFVCLVELCIRDLKTDGVGVWEETCLKTGKRLGQKILDINCLLIRNTLNVLTKLTIPFSLGY